MTGSNSMSASVNCQKCGNPVSDGVAAGLCPRCLGALAFASQDSALETLVRLGDYELLEEIARGGMGVVFRARQLSLNRIVALKVVLHGPFSSPEFVKRFRTEAAAVAGLKHPNIVGIYEVGQSGSDHYFSMEYIEGKNLAELVRENPLPARRAATYLRTLADAVQYAHEHGVVHRDLKPSNVLLDPFDQPRITDFGLAKLLGQEGDLTTTGEVLGSPAYISPEQAGGRMSATGGAGDIYSLGAILYHLITGRPPFQGETLHEILLQVQASEPVAPRRLNPSVPPDVQTICLKCLQKEMSRRYASARDLAADLARFLAGEPIRARAVSPVEKVWLWCRRRPALAGLTVALHLVMILGALGILWQWRRAEANAHGERQQRQVAEDYADRVRSQLYAGDVNFAAQALEHGNLGLARRTLATWQPADGKPDLRGFEWFYLWSHCQGEQLATLGDHDWIVTCAAFSPEGRWLATGSEDQMVKIWDVVQRTLLTNLPAATGAVLSVAFTPDGRQLVTAGLGGTRFWACDSWHETTNFPGQIASLGRQRPLLATAEVAFLYWWQPPGAIRVWNYRTGAQVFQTTNTGRVLALAPDGNTLAVAGLDHDVRLWDVNSGALRQTLLTSNAVRALNYSHDSRRLIAIVRGAVPQVFNTAREGNSETEAAGRALRGHPLDVWGADFSPDDSQIATTGSDQTLRLWDATTLSLQRTLRGHEHEVWCVAFSPDGELLATGSKDQTVKLWRKSLPITTQVFPNQNGIKPFFSPAGDKMVVTASFRPPVSTLWTLSTNPTPQDIFGPRSMGFSSDGQALVRWRRYVQSLEFVPLDSTNQTEVVLADWGEKLSGLQYQGYSSDWKVFFAIDNSGRVGVWDAATGRVRNHLQGPRSRISGAAISRSGRWLAVASRQEKMMLLFNCDTGVERKLTGHKDVVNGLDFSPDEQLLAGGSLDGTIRLWRPATGTLETTLPGHMEETTDVAFAPDGRTLASVNVGLSVKLWHLATRRELVSWDIPKAGTSVQFSPDGRHLAVTTLTNSVILFDAPLFNARNPVPQ